MLTFLILSPPDPLHQELIQILSGSTDESSTHQEEDFQISIVDGYNLVIWRDNSTVALFDLHQPIWTLTVLTERIPVAPRTMILYILAHLVLWRFQTEL
jgi:hypothetical protein